MSFDVSTTVIQNRLKALTNALDAGGAAGQLLLYGGTRPSAAGAAITSQPLLATQLFGYPSAGSISSATLTLAMGNPVLASATGLATWARFVDSNGTFVADMYVGETVDSNNNPGTAEILLSADTHPYNQLYQGGVVNVSDVMLVDS